MSAITPANSTTVRSLALMSLASISLGGIAAWLIGSMLNWLNAGVAAALGALATFIGGTLATFVVRILIGSGQSVAIAAVAAGVVRTLSALFLGLALYFVANPEGRTFWTAFLISNLLALIAESTWGIKNNAREAAPAPHTVGVRE